LSSSSAHRPGNRSAGAIVRLALTKAEAAQALGVSTDFFAEHVASELRCVRRGRKCLYPIRELERWLDTNASFTSVNEA
jgi:hypothetical protein